MDATKQCNEVEVRRFVDHGAGVDLHSDLLCRGVPLANCGLLHIADGYQILLNAGAHIDLQVRRKTYGSALVAAALGVGTQGLANLKALLDACADSMMEVTHGKYGSVLVAAAALSSIKTIKCGSSTLVR